MATVVLKVHGIVNVDVDVEQMIRDDLDAGGSAYNELCGQIGEMELDDYEVHDIHA